MFHGEQELTSSERKGRNATPRKTQGSQYKFLRDRKNLFMFASIGKEASDESEKLNILEE